MSSLSYNVQAIQAVELAQDILFDAYSFELINNQLRIFPIPGTGEDGNPGKLWFQYTLVDQVYEDSLQSGSNLITKLDLQSSDSSVVPVIQKNGIPPTVPTEIIITSSTVSYADYTIDPCGNLFGNTLCGTNNYRNYLVYNPPYSTETQGHINNL